MMEKSAARIFHAAMRWDAPGTPKAFENSAQGWRNKEAPTLGYRSTWEQP
jgi:hypothetical protein